MLFKKFEKKKEVVIVGTRHFKSMAGYKRWLAFGHMHGAFKVPGVQQISIAGKKHKVKHGR